MNDLHLQAASGKIAPSWGPECDGTYPLRTFIRDLRLWAFATDVDPNRLGPQAALRLTGQAKELMRNINPMELAFGVQQGGRQITGIEFLIARLEERFGLLEQELQIHVLRDSLGFHKAVRVN